MKEIVALKELIEGEEKTITFAKRQLADHEAGVNKLTAMVQASIETKLENSEILLAKHKTMLNNFSKQDLAELEEQERLREATKRKNYYHFQKVRLKRDTVRKNDVKIEALKIVDELSDGVQFEDQEMFEIAEKIVSLDLRVHEDINDKLTEIQKKFNELLKSCDEEEIGYFVTLNTQIPIIVLQLHILLTNINENIQESINEEDQGKKDLPKFKGFPRFEDWWIEELWINHQAYFGLYKWKSIVANLCITSDQKRLWDTIFNNWVFVKKMLNGKSKLAFCYNFAFDALVRNYGEIEEELSNQNILAMEKIVLSLITKVDFTTITSEHETETLYLKYKRKKLGHDGK